MTHLTIVLSNDVADQLRHRAERESVDPADLAACLVTEQLAVDDAFDFVGSFESDILGARDTVTFLRGD